MTSKTQNIIAEAEKDKKVEDNLKEKLRNLEILFKQHNVPRPDRILFSRWALASPDGRQMFCYKPTDIGFTNRDYNTENKAKIWLYTFPDHREEYLIERVWKWMATQEKELFEVSIIFSKNQTPSFVNSEDKSTIILKENFLEDFEGNTFEYRMIEEGTDLNNRCAEEILLGLAMRMRYDKHVNENQFKVLRNAFKSWVKERQNKQPLNGFFNLLYGIEEPLDNPDQANRFLFMWQPF